MSGHDELKEKMLSNATVRQEYERLEEEFVLIEELIKARMKAGLSQAEVARRMGTKAPVISRIESSDSVHSPSVRTLRKYAAALGCELQIKLKPKRPNYR